MLVVIFVFLMAVTPTLSLIDIDVASGPDANRNSTISYAPSGPIEILSDQDFIDQGWPGAGTPGSPYLIQGFNITTSDYAIKIWNTRKNFLIDNCYFSDDGSSSSSIYLWNVSNARIENVYFFDKHSLCFDFYWSSKISVSNYTIDTSHTYGVSLNYCNDTTLVDGVIETGILDGIQVTNSRRCTFQDTIVDSYGTYFGNSEYLTIENMTSTAEDWNSAFEISNCNSSTWIECYAYLTEYGFEIANGCTNNTFIGNTILNCYSNIFHILDSRNNTLQDNDVRNSDHNGIYLNNSNETIFRNNTIYENNRYGIFMEYSSSCSFYNDTLYDNSWSGIRISYSNFTTFFGVDSSLNNLNDGILVFDSDHCEISYCDTIENGGRGVYVGSGSDYANIHHNNMSLNSGHGIILSNSKYSEVYENYIADNEEYGIDFYQSSYCFIHDNMISDNYLYNVYLYQSSESRIEYNDISGLNPKGIYGYLSVDMYLYRNTIHDTWWEAHHFWNCENITIDYATIYSVGRGALFETCENSSVLNTDINDCIYYGVEIDDSVNITVFRTMTRNCGYEDIHLVDSLRCNLDNLDLGQRGVLIEGTLAVYWHHNIQSVNVDGKPLLYAANRSHVSYTGSNYNQVIFVNSTSCDVTGGTFRNHTYGAIAVFSDNCVFDSVTTDSCSTGIYILDSTDFILRYCISTSNTKGYYLDNSPNCDILDSTSTGGQRGIHVYNSDNSYVYNNNIDQCTIAGIEIEESQDCLIVSNDITNCLGTGILFSTAIDCGGSQNTVLATNNGLKFDSSSVKCNMTDSIIDHADKGITVESSQNILLDHISITSITEIAVYLLAAQFCEVASMDIDDSACGILIFSATESHWNHTITTSTLDGNPIYQFRDTVGGVIDASSYGQIFVYNCADMIFTDGNFIGGPGIVIISSENITVTDTQVKKAYKGVEIVFSDNCTLRNSEINEIVKEGVFIYYAINSTIQNCSASFCEGESFRILYSDYFNFTEFVSLNSTSHGLYVANSDFGIVTNSIFSGNLRGISIMGSSNLQFYNNSAFYNDYGFYISSSSDIVIINNEMGWNSIYQAYDNGFGTVWDNGVDLGNAWSDYFSGGFYDIPGSGGGIDGFPRNLDILYILVNQPMDITYFVGDSDNVIWWFASGRFIQSFTLERNEITIQSGHATEGVIYFNVDGLAVGNYTYTLTVYNMFGEFGTDSVNVTVIDINIPTIDDLANISLFHGVGSHSLTWTPSDAYPDLYEIYRNGELYQSGEWNESTISLVLDTFDVGVYNITIIVFSESGGSASDTLWVIVHELVPPTIDSPSDIEFTIGEIGLSITWNVTDPAPDTYAIYRNDILIDSGDWNVTSISISFADISESGIYNYTLIVYSESGLSASDSVQIVVNDPVTTSTTPTDTTTTNTTTFPTTSESATTNETTSSGGGLLDNPTMMLVIGIGGVLLLVIVVSCLIKKILA